MSKSRKNNHLYLSAALVGGLGVGTIAQSCVQPRTPSADESLILSSLNPLQSYTPETPLSTGLQENFFNYFINDIETELSDGEAIYVSKFTFDTITLEDINLVNSSQNYLVTIRNIESSFGLQSLNPMNDVTSFTVQVYFLILNLDFSVNSLTNAPNTDETLDVPGRIINFFDGFDDYNVATGAATQLIDGMNTYIQEFTSGNPATAQQLSFETITRDDIVIEPGTDENQPVYAVRLRNFSGVLSPSTFTINVNNPSGIVEMGILVTQLAANEPVFLVNGQSEGVPQISGFIVE